MKLTMAITALIASTAMAKTAIICSPGKDAEKYLNGIINDEILVYTAKNFDKAEDKYKEETKVIKPKHISAPAVTADKVCVTVTE